MNKNKKIIMILVIILLVILLGIGGTFAYLYVETDIFKSDKEILIEKLSELISGESNFIDTNLKNYTEKKKQSAYENSGNLTLDVQIPEEVVENTDDVNNISVNFSGKTNQAERQIEQNIEIDYGKEDLAFSINYKQDNDTYGIQSDYIGAKYTAMTNTEVQNLDEENLVTLSEFKNKMEIIKNFKFSKEEVEQIKNTYLKILEEQNADEKFSSYDISTGKSYQLTLTGEEYKNILLKFLEIFKQDTTLQNKIKTIFDGEISSNKIDEMIENIKNSEVKEFQLTIETTDKMLTGFILQIDDNIITLRKQIINDQLEYQFEIQMVQKSMQQDEMKIKIGVTSKYNGLQTLDIIDENHNFVLEASDDEQIMSYNYNIINKIKFNNSISIERLNSENSIFLDDYDETSRQNYLDKVQERIKQVNQNHIEKLGIDVNPLIFTNIYTTNYYLKYKMLEDLSEHLAEQTDKLEQQEIEMFNDRWKRYEGENQRGVQVNALLLEVVSNNMIETDNKKITVYYGNMETVFINPDSTSGPEKIDISKQYDVTMITDTETGLINGILIVMK